MFSNTIGSHEYDGWTTLIGKYVIYKIGTSLELLICFCCCLFLYLFECLVLAIREILIDASWFDRAFVGLSRAIAQRDRWTGFNGDQINVLLVAQARYPYITFTIMFLTSHESDAQQVIQRTFFFFCFVISILVFRTNTSRTNKLAMVDWMLVVCVVIAMRSVEAIH